MLNRRILRVKAFKSIYCYAENRTMSLKDAEALLELSCEATRDLYLFLLSIVGPLTREAEERILAAKSKFNPSEEERNPNMRFVGNRIAAILGADPDFQKIISKKKMSWENYDVLLRNLYESVRDRDYFKKYMSEPEMDAAQALKADAQLWCKIFETEFEDNSALEEILEDLSIYWNDDLGYALSWCIKTVRDLGSGANWSLPALYQSDLAGNESYTSDKAFVFGLLRGAYTNFDTFVDSIDSLTQKWTRDRICATDLALLVCGMAESRAFPSIPVKIIINEYVEIAKYYSTRESSSFVNGLLDKLINTKNNQQ